MQLCRATGFQLSSRQPWGSRWFYALGRGLMEIFPMFLAGNGWEAAGPPQLCMGGTGSALTHMAAGARGGNRTVCPTGLLLTRTCVQGSLHMRGCRALH